MKDNLNLSNFDFTSSKSTSASFPRQKLSRTEKTNDWKEQCVDSVIYNCNAYYYNRRSPWVQRKRNYDVFNNKITALNFDYVTNPFPFPESDTGAFQLPANIQPLDILSPNFMELIGEEGKRMFAPTVRALNADVTKSKDIKKKTLILQTLQDYISSQIQQNPQSEQELTEQLNKYSNYSPKDIRESQAQHLVTYLMKHEKLQILFSDIWKRFLLSGEQIVYVDEINHAAKARVVNDLEVYYVLPNNSNYIDEADKIYERNRMTISQIVDEFYEVLTPDQIDDLESHQYGQGTIYDYSTPVTLSMMGDPASPVSGGSVAPNYTSMNSFMIGDTSPGIDVHRVTWKSKRKIGILHYTDEQGEPQMLPIDESFKLSKEQKKNTEWFWVNEYWKGVRIGGNMYLNIQPKKHQFRSIDSLSQCKSGYVGAVSSATNSQNVSLMDRVIPWLFYCLVLYYRNELLIAKNQGKYVNFDLAMFPEGKGWTVEKVMYYATAMGIKFIDSFSESAKGVRKGILNNSGNDGKVMDTETSQSIQSNIILIEHFKTCIEETCGVNRNRKGQNSASDAVGVNERAVTQASYITEPLFAIHNDTKLRVIEHLLKITQELIADGEKTYSYVTDDMQEIYGTIQGAEFSNLDFELSIENSQKSQEIMDIYKANINNALQNDKVKFSQVANLFASESLADLKNGLIKAEQEVQEAQDKQLQADRDLQMKMHQEQLDDKQADRDLQQYIADTNNETKLAIAEMNALAIDEGPNVEGIDQAAEIGLKVQEISQKSFIEQQKIVHDKDKHKKELELKEKEIQAKKEIENKKLKQIEVQNKSQEKIALGKAKLDEKMMKQKIKLEAMKARAAIAKSRMKPAGGKK